MVKSNQDWLSRVTSEVESSFQATRRVMSMQEFLEVFLENPQRYARNAAQYIRDCFLYFGTETKPQVWGEVTHYKLFDTPFDDGRGRLVGQERAQERVFKLLDNFVREGSVNKLILLHGPNGSAKSTFIDTIQRGLEHYSHTEEGALYRFSWIFPDEKIASGAAIGFGGVKARAADRSALETFAFLEDQEINAKVPSDLKDHPLLLIPQAQREVMMRDAIEKSVKASKKSKKGTGKKASETEEGGRDSDEFALSNYILRGDLSHTSRQIFDALLTAYQGDFEKVLKHVQVERFFISQRYRSGVVTVEPQMRVDAGIRQLTVDRSLAALPTSLQNQTLYEPFGDLVDANRGLIEYDDLFKRHPDLNRYLLSTSEKASVSLENRILHLDMVLTATGNEDYLDAYKQTADYSSFKGRVELVRVPYLLDYTVEELIYREQLGSLSIVKRVAPHTTFVAALWAVLTRLNRPNSEGYSNVIRDVVAKMTPLEKADLYARGKVPENIGPERARELKSAIVELMDEGVGTTEYEGRRGASPREMKMILLNASQNDAYPTLSPLAVFDELETLVRDLSVFPFLQRKADGDYHRHDHFITIVRERYLDIIDLEIRSAMGLVEEARYHELFSRYIDHVSQSLKGEKVYNKVTSSYEKPDEAFMREIEATINTDEETAEFRQSLMTSIGAFSIDNPGAKVDYLTVFPNLFERLQAAFFDERQRQIRKIVENLLVYFESDKKRLSKAELEAVETTLLNLKQRYGYCDSSIREAVAFLMSSRYND